MPSNLESEFDALTLESMDRLVAERRQEDLHLDFKEIHRAPEFGREDRKNLAESISGFANSDGGLIVWGIEARRDDDSVDAAQSKRPIAGVEAVLSTLNTLTGQAVSPMVDGVRHRCLLEREGGGYIVTLVPRSEAGPHMAKLGEDRYFKRSGSGFYRLEHFDLEDMFGRRPKPKLEVVLAVKAHTVASAASVVSTITYQVLIYLRNKGMALARFPFAHVMINEPYQIARTYGEDTKSMRWVGDVFYESKGATYIGGSDCVLHPGMTALITYLQHTVGGMERPPEVVVSFVVGAEGVVGFQGRTSMASNEVAAEIGHPRKAIR